MAMRWLQEFERSTLVSRFFSEASQYLAELTCVTTTVPHIIKGNKKKENCPSLMQSMMQRWRSEELKPETIRRLTVI